jgi:hypothetical protein
MKSYRELMQQALDAFESGRAADRAEAMKMLRAALIATPRREWVSLTARDLAEIPPSAFEGVIWAEGKLREKNT